METEVELESADAGTTVSLEAVNSPVRAPPVPGAVLIFANGAPAGRFFRFEAGSLELGRSELAVDNRSDAQVSRKHLGVTLEASGCLVADLGSRNGTSVNGQRVTSAVHVPLGSVVRVGGAVLVIVADLIPFEHYGLGVRAGTVGGPAMRRVLETVQRIAQRPGKGGNLLIIGETGTGKEIVAQAFHAAERAQQASFTAVNCATIPKELAERLLFGSRRGAFSGATDAIGYLQSAQGGTLFLDEIAELPLDVQSKLLRIIETREVQRLGATQSERVDVRFCAATWRDLRAEVGAGRFREDLYFRIGQPEVRLPPLCERVEEIPWHVQQVLDDVNTHGEPCVSATAGFVEACLLRRWPGNVRELRAEVQRAALAAAPDSNMLVVDCLSATAGRAIDGARGGGSPSGPAPIQVPEGSVFPRDEFAEAMVSEGGNVASAARRLGVHRNRVRRWLERHQLDPRHFKRSGRAPGS
jgi:transcriptional regulator with AAA-type ATPase domain